MTNRGISFFWAFYFFANALVAQAAPQIPPVHRMVTSVVFGKDDRHYMPPKKFPFSAMGKVHTRSAAKNYEYNCGGTLVAPQIVLTALHCITEIEKKPAIFILDQAKRPRFTRNTTFTSYASGIFDSAIPVKKIVVPESFEGLETILQVQENGWDWALLILEKPIGLQYGFIELAEPDHRLFATTPLISAGYPSDRNNDMLSIEESCHLRASARAKAYAILNDCDVMGGNSGGAIISKVSDQWKLSAIHIAADRAPANEYNLDDADHQNYALSAAAFAEALGQVISALEKNDFSKADLVRVYDPSVEAVAISK